jgi:hypothetical protein
MNGKDKLQNDRGSADKVGYGLTSFPDFKAGYIF